MAKIRKSIKKRFKKTKTGKILRRQTGLNHYLAKKKRDKVRKSRKKVKTSETEVKKIKNY